MIDKAPIIFIHYGDAEFLKYTLGSLKFTNPNKRIILLGDNRNQYLAKLIGIEHYLFNDYSSGKEIELFDKVFKVIKGEKHDFDKTDGVDFWTKFVFRRWFNIYNFILLNNIDAFWIFDSDNLVFMDLAKFETDLSQFDNTEQCNGICMNGYISNQKTVKGYIEKINELFQREEYIQQQRDEFKTNTNYAFTEMRAYAQYKKEEKIKTIRLTDNFKEIYFDDCVCFEHDMETVVLKNGKMIKQLYLGNEGKVFVKSKFGEKLIPCANLNMSWVSNRLIERLYKHLKNRRKINIPVPMEMNDESWYLLYNRVYDKLKSIVNM